jgi:hypothetical protein
MNTTASSSQTMGMVLPLLPASAGALASRVLVCSCICIILFVKFPLGGGREKNKTHTHTHLRRSFVERASVLRKRGSKALGEWVLGSL